MDKTQMIKNAKIVKDREEEDSKTVNVSYPQTKSLFIGGECDGVVYEVVSTPSLEINGDTYVQCNIALDQQNRVLLYVHSKLSLPEAMNKLITNYAGKSC